MIETISFPQERDVSLERIATQCAIRKETSKLEAKIKKAAHRLIELENANGEHKDFWHAKWNVCQRLIRMSNEILVTHNVV